MARAPVVTRRAPLSMASAMGASARYHRPLHAPVTQLVVDYIESEEITVKDFIALEIQDNPAVGARDPLACSTSTKLDIRGIDAGPSACVQMPSLAAVQRVTTIRPPSLPPSPRLHQMLTALNLDATAPGSGRFPSGKWGAGGGGTTFVGLVSLGRSQQKWTPPLRVQRDQIGSRFSRPTQSTENCLEAIIYHHLLRL